ncbi:hypothetical protein DEDE109153_18065 [Deinococcus deserti]|uniref:Uncharacterized protein n=1 Tax=Deinococcus deserti (strain DSM 17065 / CIP 109153 / LMG 22923 / VCD115) TaxID=546414 RepID=C1CZ57_DEIDV|nr:hypothetical protein [Deinococcus deserti]ACO45095.1 Hypothetical protein Deide_02820 [Deinococcus deserti VCD115]
MTAVEKDWDVQLTFADMTVDPTEAFAQVFPLNPCRQGRMRSYEETTGKKESETIHSPVVLNDVRHNMTLNGHAGRLGFLPGDQNRTSVGMIDIDLKHYVSRAEMRQVVRAVTDTLSRARIFCYEEESTNGGAHLWVFLSEPVPYQLMTDALKVLITEAGHPKLELFPSGNKGAEGKWVYMPYAGAEQDALGLTFLRDPEHRWPIPACALDQAIQRVTMQDFLVVLSRKPQEAQQEAKQTTAHDLAPDGYPLLVQTTLTPPERFARHDSIEAFLNIAERMGKQTEMAEHLKSEAIYVTWVADNKRSREEWSTEIDRWAEAESDHQYGLKFLLDQGWRMPELPKMGQQVRMTRYGVDGDKPSR